MIAELTGIVIRRTPESLILDVHGVGYKVTVPLSTYYKIPQDGQEVRLNIYTHLAIDTHRQRGTIDLYGFFTMEEKTAFELLLTVSGVSPRLARNILSGVAVSELVEAVVREETARLRAIPGVGKKLSEKLILELKDKIADLGLLRGAPMEKVPEMAGLAEDVVSALMNLGYKKAQSEEAVAKAMKAVGPGATVEKLLKQTLKVLIK